MSYFYTRTHLNILPVSPVLDNALTVVYLYERSLHIVFFPVFV